MATESLSRGALPRLQWSPVITGVLCALAVHIVLNYFGTAFGLAAVPADSTGLGVLAVIWNLLAPLFAFAVGAFVCVRIAREHEEAGTYLHGALVWCIGLVAGALFITGSFASGAMSNATASAYGASSGAGMVAREVTRDEVQKAAAAAAGASGLGAILGLAGALLGAAGARRTLTYGRIGRPRLRGGERLVARTEATAGARPPGAGAGEQARPGDEPTIHH